MGPFTAIAVTWAVFAAAAYLVTVANLAVTDGSSASLGLAMVAAWAAFVPIAATGLLLGAVATLIPTDGMLRRAVHGTAAVCLVGPTLVLAYAAAPIAAPIRALRTRRDS